MTFYKNYDRRQHGEDYNKVGHSETKHVSGKNRRSDDESEQIVDESGGTEKYFNCIFFIKYRII